MLKLHAPNKRCCQAGAGASIGVDADFWIGHLAFSRWLACTISKMHAMALQQLRDKPDLTSLTLCPMTNFLEVSSHHCTCTQVNFAGKPGIDE